MFIVADLVFLKSNATFGNITSQRDIRAVLATEPKPVSIGA